MPGHFADTLRALRVLREVGLPSAIMFTLSRVNQSELLPVIQLVADERVSVFDFARMVPIGSAHQLDKEMLKPGEYHKLILAFEKYKELHDIGCRTFFGHKDHLWNLLYKELGLLKPIRDDDLVRGGCEIGSYVATVLADGTVYACRRLPIAIGSVPKESIRTIFIESPLLNAMRRIEEMEKCGSCELLKICRGCPAVAHAVHGSYLSPDPQCWR